MTGDRARQGRLWIERAHGRASASEVFTRNNFDRDANLNNLVAHVSAIHGKPIRVEFIGDRGWETLTALWVDYPDRALIIVRNTDTRLYQTHCVLHELAHIAFDHPGCNVLSDSAPLQQYRGTDGTIRGRLLESTVLGEAAVSGIGPHRAIEGEAEQLAHLLARSLFRPKYSEDEKVFG